jgi:hypothetical protein
MTTLGYFHDHVGEFDLTGEEYTFMMLLASGYGCRISPAGSRYTNGAGHDQDYLVEVPDDNRQLLDINLLDAGWTPESGQLDYRPEQGEEHPFDSWRKGELNLIVTTDHKYAQRHRLATAVLKQIKLPEKNDRIYVMYAILYGDLWSGPGIIRAFSDKAAF